VASAGKTSDTGAASCVSMRLWLTQPSGEVNAYSPDPSGAGRSPVRGFKEMSGAPKSRSIRMTKTNVGSPTGREPHGDGGPVVVAGVTTCQGGR
jgi:hypothetical protein